MFVPDEEITDVIDAYELDTVFKNISRELFDGKIIFHPFFGNLPLKFINGKLLAQMDFPCEGRNCASELTYLTYRCYLGSGHSPGAWCYAYNLKTLEYEACVQSHVYICEKCRDGRGSQWVD